MFSRILFVVKTFLFWTGFFILAKLAFLIYQYTESFSYTPSTWLSIIGHGLKLDLSVAGYLTLIPAVILWFSSFSDGRPAYCIIKIYSYLLIPVILLFTLVDLEIFKYWGTRMDKTAFRFIGAPREMLASTPWTTIILFTLTLAALTTGLYYVYSRFPGRQILESEKPGWKGLIVFPVLMSFLFLAIRGGIGIAPVSVSSVYFHRDAFPNYAAVNVVWNIGHSFLEKKDEPNPFGVAGDEEADIYMKKIYSPDSTLVPPQLLRVKQPNIILIILESFTAKLIEPLGGLKGVTPFINKLSEESIFFTNFFANDSRTDKSVVSILSGYPALGKISIIKFPNKTEKLGNISRNMAANGYHTSFVYGGDIDFGNLRSYVVNGRFQKVIELSDFGKSLHTARWGVHDEYTFRRLLDECKNSGQPFFKVYLSLSNHEPFDIPGTPKFGNNTIDEKISNSAFYTDSCFGDFIQKARTEAWWDNTLIIVLADHGTRFPGNSIVYHPEKYRIPMIWTGGAIRKDTVITNYFSQSDLARTLLGQLNIDASDFQLSRDIFRSKKHFAFYEYNNGIGMVSDSCTFVYDNDLDRIVLQEGVVTDEFLRSGRVIQQKVYDVFLRN